MEDFWKGALVGGLLSSIFWYVLLMTVISELL